jgi:cystathionine gamma-lyase
VHAVCYPGLADGQQQAVVRRQMRGFGGMLSFWLKVSSHADTVSVVRRVLARLQVFSLAESLGGVESLVAHPATMSHASLPPDERRARGIDDRLIRVSAGLEDYADLERDWAAALDEDVFDHG